MVDPSDVRRQWSVKPFFVGKLEPSLKRTFICRSAGWVDNDCMRAPRSPVNASDSSGAPSVRRTARGCVQSCVLTAMLLGALPLPAARASDTRDHERARSAVRAGEALPLPALLEKLQRTHPGQVLELELERDGGRWIYEVKLLQANGQLLTLELDAGTGQVLQVKRKQVRSADRKAESPAGTSR